MIPLEFSIAHSAQSMSVADPGAPAALRYYGQTVHMIFVLRLFGSCFT